MAKRVIDTWQGNLYPSLKAAYEALLTAHELSAPDAPGARDYLKLRRAFPNRFVVEGEEDWAAYYEFIAAAEEACRAQERALLGEQPDDKG